MRKNSSNAEFIPKSRPTSGSHSTSLSRRNLFLVMAESALTAGLLCMSIMTPFFNSIGLKQGQIAWAQSIFTVVVALLNLPAGWLADRFSRKWANVIGDFGVALTFLFYAQAQTFLHAVICECLLGFFMAVSQGVDYSLLRHFARQVKDDEGYFRRQSSVLCFWQYACTLLLVLAGGPLGAIDFRLAIALSGLPSALAGIASLLIKDDSVNLKPTFRNPFQDMGRIIKSSFQRPKLRTRIFAYAIGREMTHGIIWIFTPMLLLAGMPLSIASGAWALNSIACIIGSRLAAHWVLKLKDWQILALPTILMTCSMGILSLRINIWTISLYLLMGIVQGWTNATLMALVQEQVAPAEQTSVISFAKVVGQILYIPSVCLIGWAADFDLRFGPLMTLIIFLPISVILTASLKREEHS